MATQLQIRRGTSAQVAAFTGAEGEVVVNTTNDSIHVNDGSTAGGFELARVDGSNWAITNAISTTANISFGDNDKAIFGAGSDLQIYHDGTRSYISDSGTGDLRLRASEVRMVNAANTEVGFKFVEDGAASLYFNGNEKLTTTSTGIDVTGTVTATAGAFESTGATEITLEDTDGGFAASKINVQNGGRDLKVTAPQDIIFNVGSSDAVTILNGGSVGIGTSNPLRGLDLRTAASGFGNVFLVDTTSGTTGTGGGVIFGSDDGQGTDVSVAAIQGIKENSTAGNQQGALLFTTKNSLSQQTEAMRIDSAGNVGIGTDSPAGITSGITTLAISDAGAKTTGDKNGALAFITDDGSFTGTFSDGVTAEISSVAETGVGGAYGLAFATSTTSGSNRAERMRIDSSGNVNNASGRLRVAAGDDEGTQLNAWTTAGGNGNVAAFNLVFNTGANSSRTEAMRIDSSGNLLVGKTATAVSSDGVEVRNNGLLVATRNNNKAAILNRKTSDGDILEFNKDSVAVGRISVQQGSISIGGNPGTGGIYFNGGTDVRPWNQNANTEADNTLFLGASNSRWEEFFCANSTINTSDRNEKQDIEALSDAEQRVAVAAKGLLRKFRWIDAVEAKGDDARIHFGIIAQDLQDAFTAEGLDVARYAMWCSDTWTNDDGSEQTRLGVRYSELLAFIISAI